MHGIKGFRFLFGQGQPFHTHNADAGAFEALHDVSHKASLHGIRFDDRQSSFHASMSSSHL